MPQLPDVNALGARPTESRERPMARYDSSAIGAAEIDAAESMGDTARLAGQFGQELIARAGRSEAADARSRILRADVEARANIPTDHDAYAQWATSYREAMSTATGEALGGVASSSSRNDIEADAAVLIERGAAAMMGAANVREGDVGRSHLQSLMTANLEAALQTTDPVVRQGLFDAVGDAIEGARESSWIDDETATIKGRSFAEDYAVAWVDSLDVQSRVNALQSGMTTKDGRRVFEDTGLEVDMIPSAKRIDMLESAERELAAKLASGKSILTSVVSDIEDVLLAGETPPAADLATLQSAVGPYPGLAARLAEAEAIGGIIQGLRQQNPVAVQTFINDLSAIPEKTPGQVRALKAADQLNNTMRTELERDPLSWAARAGVLDLATLDPRDPNSVERRVGDAAFAEAVYGVDVPPMTDEEMAVFERQFRDGDAAQQMVILADLGAMRMPTQMADRLYNQVSQGMPAVGLLAEATRHDPELVRQALMGLEFLKNNPELAPSSSDAQPALQDILGNALVADTDGRARSALYDSAVAVYTQQRRANGDDLTQWDSDASYIFEKAVRGLLGEIGDRNKQKFVVPRGMTANQFDDRLDDLTDGDLHFRLGDAWSHGPHRITGDGMEAVTADKIRDDALFITTGDGQYLLGFNIGGGVEYAVTAQGDPYVFDLAKIDLGSSLERDMRANVKVPVGD